MAEKKEEAAKEPARTYQRRSNQAIAACVVASIALIALDLGTKTWAEGALSAPRTGDQPTVCEADEDGYIRYQRARRPPIVVIEDVFEFEYAENCGAAFGLLRSAPTPVRIGVFGPAALFATAILLWLFATGRGGTWFAWSVPLVISGALGNLIDRMRYGYVVDFIHWHWKDSFDYPTFNVADIAISIGVVMLLIDGFKRDDTKAAKPPSSPKASEEKPAEAT